MLGNAPSAPETVPSLCVFFLPAKIKKDDSKHTGQLLTNRLRIFKGQMTRPAPHIFEAEKCSSHFLLPPFPFATPSVQLFSVPPTNPSRLRGEPTDLHVLCHRGVGAGSTGLLGHRAGCVGHELPEKKMKGLHSSSLCLSSPLPPFFSFEKLMERMERRLQRA